MIYAVAFPAAATGLTLDNTSFVVFKKMSDGEAPTNAAPTVVTERGTGTYVFTYVAAEDVVFVLDGGASIDGESRYVRGVLSVQDDRLDAAVSTRSTVASILDASAFAEPDPAKLGGLLLLAASGGGAPFVRRDALTFDANNRPLTARIRVFASAAAANAATYAGAVAGNAEGAILVADHTGTHIDSDRLESMTTIATEPA